MATFALLDSNNIVSTLILVDDQNVPTEEDGITFVKNNYGNGNIEEGKLVQSFPAGSGKRRREARIGFYYDKNTDGFYPQVRTENPIKSTYIDLPNGTSYCVIYRNASSLFTGLIRKTFYDPYFDIGQSVQNLSGMKTSILPSGTPHAIIRDPIERFVSAYALRTGGVPCWLGVDEFIDWLGQQDQTTINKHFRKQTLLLGLTPPQGIVYHDFKSDFNELAAIFGLPTPVPVINETSTDKKPVLTDDQIAILRTIYADDVALYAQVSAQPTIVAPAPATDSTTTDATANPVDNSANPDTTTTP